MVKFGYKHTGSKNLKYKIRVQASEAGDFSGPLWQWRLESP